MSSSGVVSSATKGSTGEAHFLEEQMNPARIKQYLSASRDNEKAKGMKWLLAMMSKGRDASEFFSDVVKNVVVKPVEVKKLVYMYLEHYADYNHACRELALLSINSFQKDLGASNQLIRAIALRVLTSIRVADIVTIQFLAVKKCAGDSSPFVRKCAANAIAKLEFGEEREELVGKLLHDPSTMVLGSAVVAFSQVCPERWDLLHPVYRKLCHLAADVDEWAQIVILQTLSRYVRSQFVDPAPGAQAAKKILAQRRSAAAGKKKRSVRTRTVKKAFYSDEEDESCEEEIEVVSDSEDAVVVVTDPDHRLALRSTSPLLKSRNAGVVLAVCSLHYYCGGLDAEAQNAQLCGRALVRILRNKREIQYVVLKSIAHLASERPSVFREFLKEFFVKETDPGFNRSLKLDILTSLATTENATVILRELETYARSGDADFAASAVKAAGRVADAQPDVAGDVCSGLLALVAARQLHHHAAGTAQPQPQLVVSTSIVVVRQLLQQGACDDDDDDEKKTTDGDRRDVVRKLARLLLKPLYDEGGASNAAAIALKGSVARANVVWLLGEFRECCAEILPDALRLLAKDFANEDVEVKQQIVNLAVKASVDDPELKTLLRYVLELARFDLNHDLRDRARTLAALLGLSSSNLPAVLLDSAALLAAKKRPPLTLTGPVALDGLSNLQVGSLSVMVGHEVEGYLHLPDWPDLAPDPTTRDVPVPSSRPSDSTFSATTPILHRTQTDEDDFYGERRSEEEEEVEEETSEDDDDDESSSEGDEDDSDEEETDEDDTDDEEDETDDDDDDDSDEEEEEEETDEDEDDDDDDDDDESDETDDEPSFSGFGGGKTNSTNHSSSSVPQQQLLSF